MVDGTPQKALKNRGSDLVSPNSSTEPYDPKIKYHSNHKPGLVSLNLFILGVPYRVGVELSRMRVMTLIFVIIYMNYPLAVLVC